MQYIDTRAVAAALRTRLKAEFPGVKFSVRKGRGTGSAYIDCTWTDGPSEGDVKAITSTYEGSRWDGYNEQYNNTDNTVTVVIDGKEVTGSPVCDGIQTHREVSDTVMEEAGRRWSEYFDGRDWRTAGMSDGLAVDGEFIRDDWAPAQVKQIAHLLLDARWTAEVAARTEDAAKAAQDTAQAPKTPAPAAPAVDGEKAVTITHTEDEGTVITGTRHGDGAADLLRGTWKWHRRNGYWYLPGTRGKATPTATIEATAGGLRSLGFIVTTTAPDAEPEPAQEATQAPDAAPQDAPTAYRGVPIPEYLAGDLWDTAAAQAWRDGVDAALAYAAPQRPAA